MARDQTIQIGLRVPEKMSEQLDARAKDMGVSKNSLILILINLGGKVLDANINFRFPQE